MIEIKQVIPGVFRGPQPRLVEDWFALQKLGVKYALDLETGAHLLNDGSPLQEQLNADQYGIRVYNHPLGEILPPTQDELSWAVNFITAHQPVYVHCRAGVDRTGMVIAALRIAGKWPKIAAVQEMVEAKMHFWYYWWGWFL